MSNVDHRTLTSSDVHEPKNITNSVISDTGKVITASSSIDGTSEFRLLTPDDLDTSGGVTNIASHLISTRVLEGSSIAATQSPSAVDTPIQIEFGSATGTVSDPVMMDSLGTITINEAGLYLVKTSLQVGRTSATGVSVIYLKVDINGTQAGRSLVVKLDNADSSAIVEDDSLVVLPAGAEIKYYLMRDSAGSNYGGLFKFTPTTLGATWNVAPSAYIRIERYE